MFSVCSARKKKVLLEETQLQALLKSANLLNNKGQLGFGGFGNGAGMDLGLMSAVLSLR